MNVRQTSSLMLVALIACGPAPFSEAEPGQESPAEPDATSWPMAPPIPPDEPDATTDEGGEESGIGFISTHDVPETYMCDVFDQDCPEGEKCAWYSLLGAWDATRCVPIVPEPDDVGEPCTVDGDLASGLDTCGKGALCWDVDPETHQGTCVAHCDGAPENPTCPEGQQCIGRDLLLCLPSCCPVEQDCPEGQACYPVDDTFTCAPDAGGDSGAYLDSCEFLNVCDPGLFCANPDVLPPCDGPGCCAPFCEVGSTTCSDYDPALVCVPWFDEGQAPPIYEHTGACMLME